VTQSFPPEIRNCRGGGGVRVQPLWFEYRPRQNHVRARTSQKEGGPERERGGKEKRHEPRTHLWCAGKKEITCLCFEIPHLWGGRKQSKVCGVCEVVVQRTPVIRATRTQRRLSGTFCEQSSMTVLYLGGVWATSQQKARPRWAANGLLDICSVKDDCAGQGSKLVKCGSDLKWFGWQREAWV
jgi:hypothetical protein